MTNELGIDRSGNNNSWTVNNMTLAVDQMVDSPTNNFATWNPLMLFYPAYTSTYSEGNLKATRTDNGGLFSTIPFSSGKWYAEILILNTATNVLVGMLSPAHVTDNEFSIANKGVGYQNNGNKSIDGSATSYGATYAADDIIGIAIDLDAGTPSVTFYKNNASQGAITGFASGTHYVFATKGGGNGWIFTANFGQDSSFAGAVTAQGNQDDNSIGDFYYTPPTGYLALCTSNLPAVAVTPSEHFDVALYTGNGSTQNITSLEFQPDFTWIKNRTAADSNQLFDAIRGVTVALHSDTTAGEAANADTLTHFLSNGFTTGDDVVTNTDEENYVAWNWKAATTASGTTSGAGTGKAYSARYNTDAGFSIITYLGNGTDNHTIPHHLGKKPQFIVVKKRNDTGGWAVYNETSSATKHMYLDTAAAEATSHQLWSESEPTSSVFYTWTNTENNGDDESYIAYCFHSVEGYSKFGSYVGNNNADGTFIYLGFRPKYIMIKASTTTDGWLIYDSARDTINDDDADLRLHADNDPGDSETGKLDFLSNGVKIRIAGTAMNEAHTYIYLAFAETPFKYSNAR